MIDEIVKNINEIKTYAKLNKVPIMQDASMDFITTTITKRNIKRVLEIGTAIGYSAIMMALADRELTVTTIEKDKERYFEAIKNVKKFGLEDRITLIFNDALETSIDGEFDLILIDAAKSKNQEFFTKFERNLALNGVVITDNINFHGFTKMNPKEIDNRNIRALVKKIKNYINFLENDVKYKTTFYEIGDGLSVSERRID